MKKGLLIILSGPSGVGKGTVMKEFVGNSELNLSYSISMTTRPQRDGEIEGVNYNFVTQDEFRQAIDEGKMLEYTEFVGNFYGTPLANVESLRMQGINVLLEIEVQGCMQVLSKCPDAITIFITPPSMEELECRIRKRATEPEETIQQRLSKAYREMEMVNQYKHIVCNDDPQLAADIITLIIKHHMK